jgi:hypothetical protein
MTWLPPNAAVTRGCESRVDGGQAPRKPSDVVVGPVSFLGLRAVARQPASNFWPRRGRYLVWKSVTEVEAQEEVTLVVPQAERARCPGSAGAQRLRKR